MLCLTEICIFFDNLKKQKVDCNQNKCTMVSLWTELIQLQHGTGNLAIMYYHYLQQLESVLMCHNVFFTLKIPAAGYSDMLTST